MIVGTGDIASVLSEVDRDNTIFFASGVSNSKEERRSEFEREINLLSDQDRGKDLVYFSSLSIYYSSSAYAKHKKAMEYMVSLMFKSFTIVRLGNISWGNNPNTILNFFKNEYSRGRTPELQDVYRHIVSKEEFLYWMRLIKTGENKDINIPGEFIHVKEIWRRVINDYYRRT